MSGNLYIGRASPKHPQAHSADLAAAGLLIAVSAFMLFGVTAMVSDFGAAYALSAPSPATVATADCRPAEPARRT